MNTLQENGALLNKPIRTPARATSIEPRILPDIFLRSVAEYDLPDALSFKRDGEWKHISSAEMLRHAQNIALGLYSLGLRKGDRAAILAPNSPEWTLVDAGCQFAGIIDVPIYTTLTPETVRYIIEDAEVRVLFLADGESYRRLTPTISQSGTIEKCVLFDADDGLPDSLMTLAQLEASGELLRIENPLLLDKLHDAIAPDDVATLIYTSGTTGEPKGVMLTHANLISNVFGASEKFGFSEGDTSLSVLPLSHVFERTGMYVYLMYGMRVHYAESVEKVPENLSEVRPTIFIGVPRIFEKVFERARLKAMHAGRATEMIFDWAIEVAKEYAAFTSTGQPVPLSTAAKHAFADKLVFAQLREFFGGRLKFCITGGAALSDEIFLIFTGAGISIMQGYGMTEASPVITTNVPDAIRVGTVGKPIWDVKVRIASDGEIEISGPGVMKGYYKKDEATLEAFTDDGWLKTGDIGTLDADGYLRITDRKKELFKTSGGKYIAPAHIEQKISLSRFVSQVVLVGNHRKFPAALIVPDFEMLESYARLKELDISSREDYCRHDRILDLLRRQIESLTADLAQYEKVKKFAVLASELTVENGELTPTLKIKRRVVDFRYREIIDSLYRDTKRT